MTTKGHDDNGTKGLELSTPYCNYLGKQDRWPIGAIHVCPGQRPQMRELGKLDKKRFLVTQREFIPSRTSESLSPAPSGHPPHRSMPCSFLGPTRGKGPSVRTSTVHRRLNERGSY